MKKNTKKGFTLVELLVVIAILAILSSVAVVGYTAFINNAKESAAKTELHQIETSVNAALMAGDDIEIGKVGDAVVYVGVVGDQVTAYTLATTGSGATAVTTKNPISNDTDIVLTGDFAGLLLAEDGKTLKIKGATLTYTYATSKSASVTFKK